MINSLGFDIFARDHASAVAQKVGKSTKQLAVDLQGANVRVEKATRTLALAETKFGKSSLEARDASVKLGQAQLRLNKTTKESGDRAKESGGKWAFFKDVMAVVLGEYVVEFGKKSVEAFKESQLAQSALQDTFRKFPRLADTNIEEMNKLNEASERKTKYDHNTIASGESVLAQFRLTGTQIKNVTPLLLDYASKTGKDVPEAAGILGKAILGQGRGLKAVGINFKDTGTVAGNYAEIMDGLKAKVGGFAELEGKTAAGQTARLSNEMKSLEEQIGQKLIPVVVFLGAKLLDLSSWISDNRKVVVPLIAAIAGLTLAIYAVNAAARALESSKKAFISFGTAVRSVGDSGGIFRKGLSSIVGFLGGPWGVALTVGALALGYFVKKHAEASQRTTEFRASLNEETGALTQNSRASIFNTLQQTGAVKAAKELGISLSDLVDTALNPTSAAAARVGAAIDAAGSAAANMTKVEGPAADAAREHVRAAVGLRDAIGGSNKVVTGAVTGFKDMQAAGAGAAVAQTDFGKDATKTTKAIVDQRTAAEKLRDTLDKLKGKTIAADEAQINYRDSVATLSQAFKDNGKTVDISTDKGRRNRQAVIDATKSADDYLVALRDSGVGQNKVRDTAISMRNEMVKVATHMGLTRAAAQRLIDKYLAIPPKVSTNVAANTASASTAIARYALTTKQRLANIPDQGVTVTIGTKVVFPKDWQSFRAGERKARGGAVFGAGGPTDDMVPAMLSAGEHVWTAREVNAAGGHDAVSGMRRSVLGYGAGGAVNLKLAGKGAAGSLAWFEHMLQPYVTGEAGMPQLWLAAVLTRIRHESAGNPTIVNKWDSNWRAGTPSVGLMQVIGPTYRTYAGPFRGWGPFEYGVSTNPLANIYAGLNYASHRYGRGNVPGVMVRSGGYDRGGLLMPGYTLAYNGTGRAEHVMPPTSGSQGGNTYQIHVAVSPTSNAADIGAEIVYAIRQYERRSGNAWRR